MTAFRFRIVYLFGHTAASCIGGWYLGALVSRMPFWMPQWLYASIHAALNFIGLNKIDNEDDIETLGLVCLLVTSCAVVAIVLWTAMTVITRYVRRWPRSS